MWNLRELKISKSYINRINFLKKYYNPFFISIENNYINALNFMIEKYLDIMIIKH